MTATAASFIKDRFPKAKLVLRDGGTFEGYNFGAPISTAGECVFTTGMVGYPESLTDPSYHGQMLVITTPMVGNYGVPNDDKDAYGVTKAFESENGKIHAAAVIVSEYCEEPVHWEMVQSLHQWLASQGIPGLMQVDTRSIVLKLRTLGTALGKIVVADRDVPFVDPNLRNLVAEVSCSEVRSYGHGNIKILCLDMGIKLNTIRCFLKHDVEFVVAPHNHDITKEVYDGLFISNGPGNPALCTEAIRSVRWAIGQDKPIFGICMGNQVMAQAAGAKTFKMKYGHRGQNQPCRYNNQERVVITTQNHGFAVDSTTLPDDWEEMMYNPNDMSNEAIKHKTKPFFAVQFHPEGRCGPQDTEYLFKEFVDTVKAAKIQAIVAAKPTKVMVLGAGGITIAQAGEFDYSGSQCLKSLREEGIQTVLINPNIATVQTDHNMADQIYFVPVTPEQVERVIEKERPDGILLGWGGQTALNCGVALHKAKVFEKYNVRVLGTQISTIAVTEDRELFRDSLLQIDEHVARSLAVTTLEDGIKAAETIGYPVMVRAAFCLGGQGSGVVDDLASLTQKVREALAIAPQVLIEESVKGWKEIEYEVVRDIYDNCITVCNMENFDPMGVHTGESIVVAPSQTLTNDEYHMLRTASIKIIRHLGVVGECNVQYGLDPKSSRYVVIEVNARLSRSSALASKATGYPLAHVAAKIALGKSLSDVTNGVTKTTNACFEPSLDYIVVKMPRWDLKKFNLVSPKIGTMMKSVGEVMSIGRTFQEAIQKALRMVDPSIMGFDTPGFITSIKDFDFEEHIRRPTPDRIWAICLAMNAGISVDTIWSWSKINKFFLLKLLSIVNLQKSLTLTHDNKLSAIPHDLMLTLKQHGFSDKQIAFRISATEDEVFDHRHSLKILPKVKQIDTVAGEFPAAANYLFTSYNAQTDDVSFGEECYVVLGCGVYRIGNSVEFDYGGVLVTRELRRLGHRVIVINYNPETVSTDYDECDRLYFEEVSQEVIRDVLSKERAAGVVVSVGGQIVQNMALSLKNHGLPILGTDPLNIDMAEDRNKFSSMCDTIKVPQPEWISATKVEQVHEFAAEVGFPILVRPSYVLSGSAMSVIWNTADVDKYLSYASLVSGDHPVVVSKYYRNSVEYDVDIVAFHGKVLCYAICEHVESAGVHSGDATMFLPPQKLTDKTAMKAIHDCACQVATRLDVVGPMNMQLLRTADGSLKVIEANVRCSRSVPFVSKTLGISFPAVMVSAFLSKNDSNLVPIKRQKMTHIGCKASMFSFNRLAGADPILGVEMASTGEVGVFGRDKHEVILKAMLCQGFRYPTGSVIVSIDDEEEVAAFIPYAKLLATKLKLHCTPLTAGIFEKAGIENTLVNLPRMGLSPDVEELIDAKAVTMVVQLRKKSDDFLLRRMEQKDAPPSYWVRRLAVDMNIPLITQFEIAELFSEAFVKYTPSTLEIEPFSAYVPQIFSKLQSNNNCALLHKHRVGLVVSSRTAHDSSVLALRLKEENLDLTCFHADLGHAQDDSHQVKDDLAKFAIPTELVDLRDQMASACFDVVMAQAAHPERFWQIGKLGHHVRGVGIVNAMRASKMTVVAQASGRTKREMRFEKYVKTLFPEMGVYTPWRDERMREEFPTTKEKIEYLAKHGLKGGDAESSDYKTSANIGGRHVYSEDKKLPAPLLVRQFAPGDSICADAEFVSLTFKNARCSHINGKEVTALNAMQLANEIGGRNGLGLSRSADGKDLFESPGIALLATGLKYIYEELFDVATKEVFAIYTKQVSKGLFDGVFGGPACQSALLAVNHLAATIPSATVDLELHAGQAIFLRVESSVKSTQKGKYDTEEAEDVFQPGNGSFSDVNW